MKGRFAVTPRSLSGGGYPALEPLKQAGFEVIFLTPWKPPAVEDLEAFVPSCVGYLAGVESIPSDVLRGYPNLIATSRNGVGVDNIDLDAAAAMGIAGEQAVGANSQGVAELAIALMLAGLRHVPWCDQHWRSGEWNRKDGIEVPRRSSELLAVGRSGRECPGWRSERATGASVRNLLKILESP